MSFRSSKTADPPAVQVQVADRNPYQYRPDSGWSRNASNVNSPSTRFSRYSSIVDVGIFRDTLAPSLALHSSLAVLTWGVARSTDYAEAKDWLWPGGMVINAWWSALGRRVIREGLPLSLAMKRLSWVERVLLTGVSAWGLRLLYRVSSRYFKRGKTDDPRYVEAKKEEGFWNNALVKMYLPEAVFQSIITLPFTAPFRHEGHVLTGYHPYVQMAAVGLFSAGFAMEVLADSQQQKFKEETNDTALCKEGVWSIVRHPNYLGDALIHFSFPLLLYGSDMLAPVELLGPIANYIFLRYVGGDKENEASQEARYKKENPEKKVELYEYQRDKNAFWPDVKELQNPWFWGVVACGGAGVVLEQLLHTWNHQ